MANTKKNQSEPNTKDKEEILEIPKHTIFDDTCQYVRPDKEKCLVAVNVWERKVSKTMYMYATYKFMGILSQMINGIKDHNSYLANRILELASKAAETTQLASTIYVRSKSASKEKLQEKVSCYDKASAYLTVLVPTAHTFLMSELELKHITQDKYMQYMGEIAITTNSILSLIAGSKKSDRNAWKEIHEKLDDGSETAAIKSVVEE